MRVVVILAAYNEERFIKACIDNYILHRVEVYLLDNESTDNTMDIAKSYIGNGVIAVETIKHYGFFDLRKQLQKKEEVAGRIKSDWFIHADLDEIRLPPTSETTLAEALQEVDREGYNAVNFMEFTFVPTVESPDHDHPHFQHTMRWYYPFARVYPHRVNAWKSQGGRRGFFGLYRWVQTSLWLRLRERSSVHLAEHGGHRVTSDNLKIYPTDFKMKHYLYLSKEHAIRKFCRRVYSEVEIKDGWHRMRARIQEDDIRLPSERKLRVYVNDDQLDASAPLREHLIIKG